MAPTPRCLRSRLSRGRLRPSGPTTPRVVDLIAASTANPLRTTLLHCATTAAVEAEPPGEPGDGASPDRSSHQRFLTVRPGDSLWSIAKRLLGPDASSAQIARKVAQLWKLNGERIGTGRPDLLLVGTKLIVR